MKTLFLFTLISILALNLNARENPFEATNIFEDEVGKIVDMDEKAVKNLWKILHILKRCKKECQM